MFGQSLGGIIGTVFMGIEPDIKAGVPNVPGGTFVDAALLSESNRPLLTFFLGSRLPSLLNGGVGGFTDPNRAELCSYAAGFLRIPTPIVPPIPTAIPKLTPRIFSKCPVFGLWFDCFQRVPLEESCRLR
jgi:hypothetical protein